MNLPNKHNLSLTDFIVLLAGLALVLAMGYLPGGVLGRLLEAIGTGLIGAGFVSFLIRHFYAERERESIEVVAERRIDIEDECLRRKLLADKNIDVLGVALTGALKDFANDERLLKKVLFRSLNVRLLFLNPLAGGYMEQRATEDGVLVAELQEVLRQSVISCVAICYKLQNLYDSAVRSKALDRGKVGSFEIRLIDICPYFAILRIDDSLLWSIYTSSARGLDSAALRVPREQGGFFGQLRAHFDKLWNMSSDNYLIRHYVLQAPTLNEELIEKVLGSDWESRL